MSMISTVSADWLALRCEADDAARSSALLSQLSAPAGPLAGMVHDLGSGTGAMLRWLAPRLAGPQRWVLHDGDEAILAARGSQPILDAEGAPVEVATSIEALAELDTNALRGASLVTASALLDVITRDEAAAIVAACTAAAAPAFFSLTVTGEVALRPSDPLDRALRDAFNDHQRRVADGRRLLGPEAVSIVRGLFVTAGWRTRTASTPWLLGPDSRRLVGEWLDGWVGAAVEQTPELAAHAAAYLVRRRAELATGSLRVRVQHEDLIAWPA
ncbi:SAM-dependent methyltransferase [Gryllotalpicola reticulitermitis]|uniref:SAM-dependent methyltransferase n=1 Tax=Gryllotalpicola reticulitermitis TaxID=1184153 RepID=A0ABV8Q7J3_9MICO